MESFEKVGISAVLALDMSAAFDLVDKTIFLDKMAAYNAQKSTLNWIDSYMSGRKQQVYIDGSLSEQLEVKTGVPQGSMLGFILCN